MCLIDDGDGRATVLSAAWRRARKAHRCSECARTIGAGERYHHEATLYEGEFEIYRTCAHCMRVRAWLLGHCGGWLYGGLWEDISEHDEVRARILAGGMRRKWTRRDGTLWRLP